MTGITISVELTFNQQHIEDLLCCAFEGGIGYWAQIKSAKNAPSADYAYQFPVRGGTVTLEDSTGEGWPAAIAETLDLAGVKAGLQTMAREYPHHFANFMEPGLMDATTGDVFVQCCLFSEVVFG